MAHHLVGKSPRTSLDPKSSIGMLQHRQMFTAKQHADKSLFTARLTSIMGQITGAPCKFNQLFCIGGNGQKLNFCHLAAPPFWTSYNKAPAPTANGLLPAACISYLFHTVGVYPPLCLPVQAVPVPHSLVTQKQKVQPLTCQLHLSDSLQLRMRLGLPVSRRGRIPEHPALPLRKTLYRRAAPHLYP